MEMNQKCQMIKSFLMKVYPSIGDVRINENITDGNVLIVYFKATDCDDDFNPLLALWEIGDKIKSFFNISVGYFNRENNDWNKEINLYYGFLRERY
jgi:hypothetical protein